MPTAAYGHAERKKYNEMNAVTVKITEQTVNMYTSDNKHACVRAVEELDTENRYIDLVPRGRYEVAVGTHGDLATSLLTKGLWGVISGAHVIVMNASDRVVRLRSGESITLVSHTSSIRE